MEILPSASLDPLTVTNEPCKLHRRHHGPHYTWSVPVPWRSLNNLCINRTAMSKIHTVMCAAMQPHLKLQGIRLYRSSGETEMISSLTSDPTKAEVP